MRRPGGGHNRYQGLSPLRVIVGNHLTDHSAHGCTDHVGTLNIQRVQNRDRIDSHILQRIGRVHLPAELIFQ